MKTRKIVMLLSIMSLCIGLIGCAGKQSSDNQSTEEQKGTLVVYFSATGNTKAIAENLANGLSADIYEIVPAEPYTDADLDYNDDNSRSTVEMNDPSVRPAIAGSIENIEKYDTVYIGYPKMEYGNSLFI